MNKAYQIPPIHGDTGLRKAISLMLQRYMQSEDASLPADPTIAPGAMALRFAWWLFDHPEELEAATVEIETADRKNGRREGK